MHFKLEWALTEVQVQLSKLSDQTTEEATKLTEEVKNLTKKDAEFTQEDELLLDTIYSLERQKNPGNDSTI